ncbi:MAG: hypothetical protein SGILL_007255 [Bacillariaceae sp.]
MGEEKEAVYRETWGCMFSRLAAFKERHGHCHVPAHTTKLGRWVVSQRTLQKAGTLKKGREQMLTQLGLRWFVQQQFKPHTVSTKNADEKFAMMCNHVAEYVKKHGSGWIPQAVDEPKGFGTWARNRRSEKKRGSLSMERVQALDMAGFLWTKTHQRQENTQSQSACHEKENQPHLEEQSAHEPIQAGLAPEPV